MPIPFTSIPQHIQTLIVAKQDFHDFPKFSQCSREACNISNTVKTRFVLTAHYWYLTYVDSYSSYGAVLCNTKWGIYKVLLKIITNLPVIIVADSIYHLGILDDQSCEWFISFLLTTSWSAKELFVERPKCSLHVFNRLLDVSNVAIFSSKMIKHYMISFDYLRVPAMNNISNLSAACMANDDQFLSLKMPSLFLDETTITSEAFNVLLKEWIHGTREIKNMRIKTRYKIDENVVLNGIEKQTVIVKYKKQQRQNILKREDGSQLSFVLKVYQGLPSVVELNRIEPAQISD